MFAARCPICFESSEPSNVMSYASMSNHSWRNSTLCDAHGICRDCMARYVEIQILEEGHFNPRCPGEGCGYRLVPLDVQRSLERSAKGAEALARFDQLRSECHAGRLKELLSHQDDSTAAWLLAECQPCPQCLTLVRREEGCLHVFCRCGCDFCFGCGGPDPEGCICHYMEKTRDVVFAAWLRTSPESPFDWLWDSRQGSEEERFLGTLHFWLWMARIPDVPAPWEEPDDAAPVAEHLQGLEPIRWASRAHRPQGEWEERMFDDGFSDLEGLDDQEDDEWLAWYHRAPSKPIRHCATQRQSRRADRHSERPLRWATRRTPGARAVLPVPLHPQRQRRTVAAATRPARRALREARL